MFCGDVEQGHDRLRVISIVRADAVERVFVRRIMTKDRVQCASDFFVSMLE